MAEKMCLILGLIPISMCIGMAISFASDNPCWFFKFLMGLIISLGIMILMTWGL